MKKGDLVWLVVSDTWTEAVAKAYGYLWVVISAPSRSAFTRAKSVATGTAITFHTKELEQANEEG